MLKQTSQNHLLPKEFDDISKHNQDAPGMLSQGRSQDLGKKVIAAPSVLPVLGRR